MYFVVLVHVSCHASRPRDIQDASQCSLCLLYLACVETVPRPRFHDFLLLPSALVSARSGRMPVCTDVTLPAGTAAGGHGDLVKGLTPPPGLTEERLLADGAAAALAPGLLSRLDAFRRRWIATMATSSIVPAVKTLTIEPAMSANVASKSSRARRPPHAHCNTGSVEYRFTTASSVSPRRAPYF